MTGDRGWWDSEPRDLRCGCAVMLAGGLLGWAAVAGVAALILRWWAS